MPRIIPMSSRPSAQWLVGWFYERMFSLLHQSEWEVVWKQKYIFGKGRVKRPLCGLVEFEDRCMYLSPSLKIHPDNETLLLTVIHECAHVLFGEVSANEKGFVPHASIFELEALANHFTHQQKKDLLALLPFHPSCLLRKK